MHQSVNVSNGMKSCRQCVTPCRTAASNQPYGKLRTKHTWLGLEIEVVVLASFELGRGEALSGSANASAVESPVEPIADFPRSTATAVLWGNEPCAEIVPRGMPIVDRVFDLIPLLLKTWLDLTGRSRTSRPRQWQPLSSSACCLSPKVKLELETAGTDQLAGVAVHM
jgi:hypothetical protein